MSIKEGDYVRIRYMYNNAKIAKVVKVLEKDPCYKNMQMYQINDFVLHDGCSFISNKIYKEDIIKYSKDVVDLIEVRRLYKRSKNN